MPQGDLPVPYSFEFEGERVKKESLQIEFGGENSLSFELLTSEGENEVKDGEIEVIGPDIGQLNSSNIPCSLAIIVNVYGRKMQVDFEPILERQIHRFLNYTFGVVHSGQRDMIRVRVSCDTYLKGFRLRHIGIILHAMLHQEYSVIVDKAQIKIYTRREDVERLRSDARKVFDARDERLSRALDESEDVYYSCLICQSLAPNHVCIITPQRPGLCGSYSWLDAKAAFEIVPTGPNQPILKGKIINEKFGQWEGVNQFIEQKSHKSINRVNIYALMDYPLSSSALLECIVAVIPEANGVMVVSRDYSGVTPLGMNFTSLSESVCTGAQTPGFLGIAKLYILSSKFIAAEGGIRRLVWMPKKLKKLLGEKIKKIACDINEPDLLEQIADEGVANTLEELLSFLSKVKHPALSMDLLI